MSKYPQEIKIIEVGPRDGLQNESTIISREDKLSFIKKLGEAGLTNIEAGAFVHPQKVPQMADSLELIKELDLTQNISYSALVPNLKGLERAKESGIERIAVFTAASESFTKNNINMSIKESLKTFEPVITEALASQMTVRAYLSTCWVCPYEGDIAKDKVLDLSKELKAMGVDEISLGDTIGAAAPNNVKETLDLVLSNISSENLALHFHDTYGTALANVVAGLDMGITKFDASAGGLGGCPYAPGASGNLATEDLVYLMKRMGIETGVDLDKLVAASGFMQKILNRRLVSKNLQRLLS